MRRENTYAKTMLGKILIVADRVRWQTIPMAYVCYGGCVIGLLSLWGGARSQSVVSFKRFFFWSLELNSYLARSIILCMYVDYTKCL
jgi:hypothetical protein